MSHYDLAMKQQMSAFPKMQCTQLTVMVSLDNVINTIVQVNQRRLPAQPPQSNLCNDRNRYY